MTGISFQSNLKIKDESEEYQKQLFVKSMLEVSNLAKMKAPVDTGFLRNSIQFEIISDTQIYVTSYAPYSYFMEFGTKYHKMQPYMRPAMDEVRQKRIQEIANNLNP